MPDTLLDGNLLIAMSLSGHVHHDAASRWMSRHPDRFATCPITEGSLVREIVRGGDGVDAATELLRTLAQNPRHDFWPDDVAYADVLMTEVIGHKQVTDAYLAQLARAHSGRLATFDRTLVSLHSDVADLVPTEE